MVRTAETYDRFEKPLANLLDVLQADLLHRRMDTETLRHERNEILRSWPRTRPPQTTSVAQRLSACDFLDVTKAAAAHAPTHHIVAGLAPLLNLLRWSVQLSCSSEVARASSPCCVRRDYRLAGAGRRRWDPFGPDAHGASDALSNAFASRDRFTLSCAASPVGASPEGHSSRRCRDR